MHITRRSKAAFAGTQAPGVYRLKVGAFEVTVLSDGFLPLDPKIFTGDAAETAKLLDTAFLPKGAIATSVNEWLVNTGDKLVLIDTGTSNVYAPTLGRMATNLAAAGVEPAAVDIVILTHMHPDHVAGLLTTEKKVAFPNATVHVHEAGYQFWPLSRRPPRRRMTSSPSSKLPATRLDLTQTLAKW
jgi:glyoxylase-like metal-dependent hydrolase (beta-lactamase superfamily II)